MPKYTFPLATFAGLIGLHWGSDKGASDLFAPIGTKVRAITAGVVESAGYSEIGGNNVAIKGADGLTYYYAHLRDLPLVKAGQAVTSGQEIGAVGQTGNAAGTDPHLHIGIGYGIQSGTGPTGGSGIGFDAVAFLQKLLLGIVDPLTPDGSNPAPTPAPPASGTVGTGLGIVAPSVWPRVVAGGVGVALVVGGLVAAFLVSDAGQTTIRLAAKTAKKAAMAAAV